MDELGLVLVGGGVAIAGSVVASVVTWLLTSRSDRRRWLRERRYEAYVGVIAYDVDRRRTMDAIESVPGSSQSPAEKVKELERLRSELSAHQATLAESNVPLTLLGPATVTRAARDYQNVRESGEADVSFGTLLAAMQRAIGTSVD